jgi:hypothetical protein
VMSCVCAAEHKTIVIRSRSSIVRIRSLERNGSPGNSLLAYMKSGIDCDSGRFKKGQLIFFDVGGSADLQVRVRFAQFLA